MTMKHLLLSSVSGFALLVSATPVRADTPFTGILQVQGGAGSTNGPTIGAVSFDDPMSFEGKAKGLWGLSDKFHLQVDLFAERISNVTGGTDAESASTLGAAVHLVHPYGDRFRFGLAGSVWENDTLLAFGSRSQAGYGLLALEGQYFGSDWTVSSQFGAFDQISCDAPCGGTLEDGKYLQGKFRYFLSDNTSLSLATTQMWGTLNDEPIFGGKAVASGDTHYAQWRLEAEHRLTSSPFSGIAALSHERNEVDYNGLSTETNTLWLGFRFHLDQPTLRAQDRNGAEFETPTFGNAVESEGVLSLMNNAIIILPPT
jgi:hypothetical protein